MQTCIIYKPFVYQPCGLYEHLPNPGHTLFGISYNYNMRSHLMMQKKFKHENEGYYRRWSFNSLSNLGYIPFDCPGEMQRCVSSESNNDQVCLFIAYIQVLFCVVCACVCERLRSCPLYRIVDNDDFHLNNCSFIPPGRCPSDGLPSKIISMKIKRPLAGLSLQNRKWVVATSQYFVDA